MRLGKDSLFFSCVNLVLGCSASTVKDSIRVWNARLGLSVAHGVRTEGPQG